jgi:hypothetical protein
MIISWALNRAGFSGGESDTTLTIMANADRIGRHVASLG